MAIIIVALGGKGGTGKSTTSKQVGVLSASRGKMTALIDCDIKQFSLELWNNRRNDFGMAKHLDYNGKLNLLTENGEMLLGAVDSCIAAGFEVIVVDLPGKVESRQAEMLLKSDFAFCPVSGSPDDYDVLPEMSDMLERCARFKPDIKLNVLYNKAHTNSKRRDMELEDLEYQCSKMARLNLLPIYIKDVVSIKDAAKYGLSLQEYSEISHSNIQANDHNILSYQKLYEIIFDEKWSLSKEFANGKAISETA